MTDERNGIELLFKHIIELDMLAHELEVARRIVADGENGSPNFHFQYYTAQIPTLKTRVIEKYEHIWSNLQKIKNEESGIARIAMRSIIKNCDLDKEVSRSTNAS
jgi:hypothetical protein